MINPETFLKELLFLVMLINPISKVAVVPMLINNKDELHEIVIKSTLFGGAFLILFAFMGRIILDYVFHLDLNALMVAGGIVIFYFGFQALRRGMFFEMDRSKKVMELAIVPLASPLIAGPATITVAIYNSAAYTPLYSAIIVTIAVAINFVAMYFSPAISKALNKFNLTGAFIRIMGLFVASIGINMVMDGLRNFFF